MSEFKFRITTIDGITLTYSFRANEKLDAFAKAKERFPESRVELISITTEEGRVEKEPPTEEKMIKLLEKLHEDKMTWFVLGSLISADSLNDEEDYKENLETLEMMAKAVPKTNIQEDYMKDKIASYIKKSIKLLKEEYKEIYDKDL